MKLHFASAKKVDVVIEDALMLAIFVLIYVTDVCKKDLTDLNRNILRFYCNIKHCSSDFCFLFLKQLCMIHVFTLQGFLGRSGIFMIQLWSLENGLLTQKWSTLHYIVFYWRCRIKLIILIIECLACLSTSRH